MVAGADLPPRLDAMASKRPSPGVEAAQPTDAPKTNEVRLGTTPGFAAASSTPEASKRAAHKTAHAPKTNEVRIGNGRRGFAAASSTPQASKRAAHKTAHATKTNEVRIGCGGGI